MSAILLGQREDRFDNSIKKKEENDSKEQIIEGKNKTYVISKTLGKGTFGKVKIAYNINNKKEKYACKILLKSNIKDEDDYIRCKREMEILKRMHHVNVVRTYEIISTETTYFIFMDFCAKGELFNYIVEEQHLSEEKSAFFFYQIINGVEYIHNKGVCHRDLKPENLLLTEKMKLKIIDFGLSNFFSGNLLETPCGSPCYASPEMVMGKKYNGFCIDIWSSGIILYAMLCGYLPFEEMENDEYNEVLFKNIVECNVEYPNEFISPLAKDLLTQILVKDPKKRIKIEEIKQHNFYLLGEFLYKQTFENSGGLKDVDLFFNDFLEKKSSIKDNKKNMDIIHNLEKEEKVKDNSIMKTSEDKSKNNIEEKNNKNEIKDKKNNSKNDLKVDTQSVNKENINSNNNINKKSNNNYRPIREEILYNSEKIKENKKSSRVEKNENKEDNLSIIPKIDDNNTNNKNNIDKNIKNEKQNNKLKILTESKNKNSTKKEKVNVSKDSKEDKKQSSKQLSSPNYNNAQLLTAENQKIYYNTILKLLHLKTDKNSQDEKIINEISAQEDSNIKLGTKKSHEINFNNHYLNTEIYPTNSRTKYKNKKEYYQCRLLNKNPFNDNKLTFNNILKSLQNKYNFKSKTPNRYTIKKKVTVKKNILSNSINKAKNKYSSHSPGIRNLDKINNNIHLNIEKNLNFPRQSNAPLTTHNNKNSYYLLNDNLMKNFNVRHFFQNNNKNKNIKPNKKFVDKDNNNKNNLLNKKNNKNIINYGINKKEWNLFNNENNVKTINSGKINNEKEISKKSVNKALNLRSFDYCLSSNTSKKKHPIIDSKIVNLNNNYNFHDNIFNKNQNQKNHISKKSFGNLNGENIYLHNNKKDNSKPVLINSNNSRINTEISNNKISNNIKNRINLSTNKNYKLNSKNKRNDFHKLFSHKLNYMNNKNKDNDNNIIINFNILKPNIFFDQQKSSKKAKISKFNSNLIPSRVERRSTENNFSSTMRNNTYGNISKNKNYKNIDTNQINKSKEFNQIIKSMQKSQKYQGNINNNKKRMNIEIMQTK